MTLEEAMQRGVRVTGEVLVRVEHKDGTFDEYLTNNLVSDAGDLHYAQRAVSEALTNAFTTLELGTAGNAPAKGSTRADMTTKVASSQKAIDSTYPKRNDNDTDNTGAGTDIVSHRFSYAKGAFTGTAVDRGIITNASPGASEPVLTYFTFAASFNVTADDTVKVFVNHTMNGV